MKKILLFLLTLVSLQAFSRIDETVTFDFSNPSGLNATPKLQMSVNGNVYGNIVNTVFNAGEVTLSFTQGMGIEGVMIEKVDGVNFLSVRHYATMTISAADGCEIQSISFAGAMGSLQLAVGEAGIVQYLTWSDSKNQKPNSVKFENGDGDAYFNSITVKYSRPSTPLSFYNSTPANGATVESFSSMSLSFDADLTVKNSSGITLQGPASTTFTGSETMNISVSGTTAVASVAKPIAKDGTYTVQVAAGTFANSEGSLNDAFSCTFKIYAKRTTLTYATVTPADKTTLAQIEGITLTFNDDVVIDESKNAAVKLNDVFKGVFALTLVDKNTVSLTNTYVPYTDKGTWTIEVPEGAIHNTAFGQSEEYDRWNDAFTLTYTVEREESALMKEARSLLQTGIGYPATTTDAYKNLKSAIDNEASDEELAPLMDAYLNETEVELPASGSYYKIANVGDGGNKLYYVYSNGELTTSSSATDAYSFLATKSEDGTFTLSTTEKEPKYLTSKGIGAATNLTLAKLEGKWGQLAISDAEGSLSGGYVFETGTQPEMPIDPSSRVYLQAKLSPDPAVIQKAGDQLTLFILNVDVATLSEEAGNKVCFYTFETNRKVTFFGDILTPVEGTSTQFAVNTTGMSAGRYILYLPKGTFICQKKDKVVVDDAISLEFQIVGGGSGGGETTTVTPTLSLSKSVIEKPGEEVIVTINNVDQAILQSSAVPYFVAYGSTAQIAASMTAVLGDKRQYRLNTSNLTAGTTYTLYLPKGTFNFTKTGATVNDVEMSSLLTVKSASGGGGGDDPTPEDPTPSTGFSYSFADYVVVQFQIRQGLIADVDLNDLVITAYTNGDLGGVVANPAKQVKVIHANSASVLATGHFENYPTYAQDYNTDGSDLMAIKLVLDNPIEAGTLDNMPGYYGYLIPDGAFGDQNYGKYLKNPSSVKPADCKVVKENTSIIFQVNNKRANIKTPDADVLAKAIWVANTTGPGYPSASNLARSDLKNLVNKGQGDNETFNDAMEMVYAVTEVDMPANGKYYKVEAVTANGSTAWLEYDGTSLSLTKNEKRATALKTVTNNSGTYRLQTGDGKYVATLSRLVATYDDDCAQTFAKLAKLPSITNAQVYGLLSLKSTTGYAVADVNEMAFAEPTPSLSVFTNDRTSGFRLTEVAAADVTAPQITASLSPASGSQISVLENITVSFSGIDRIESGDLNKITLKSTDGTVTMLPKSVIATVGKPTEYVISFLNVPDNKVYNLTIGEGAFRIVFAETFRNVGEVTGHYTVRETTVTEEQKAAAKELLDLKGIGYPTTNSAGRKALQAIVDNGGTDVEYEKAVAAYYAETAVGKPASGKYYRILAIASDNSGAWLQFDGTSVVLTRDSKKAAAFKTEATSDGTFIFTLDNGTKFLRLMTAAPSTNLTTSRDETLNALELEKLPVGGTLGLLAIKGSLDGKNEAYAQADVPGAVFTSAAGATPVYTTTLTNGFRFMEVSEADLPTPQVNTVYTPGTGAELEKLEKVTINFTIGDVKLADQSLITLTGEDSKVYKPASIALAEGTTNTYNLTFGELPYGQVYTLTLGQGAFTFVYDGRTIKVDASSAAFNVLPERATNVQVTTANSLLKRTGVGYPAASSASRLALQAFADAVRPTLNDFVAARDAYYKETDIEKPVTDHYYRIAAVADDGSEAWLKYDGNELSLTKDTEKATGLKATDNGDGTFSLATGDGKFLGQLGQLTASYDEMTNGQMIDRLNVNQFDPIATLGLVSLRTQESGYALANIAELKTAASTKTLTHFSTDKTNAFRIVATAKEEIAAPDVTATFNPDPGTKLDVLESITITLSDNVAVSLNDKGKVMLNAADGTTIMPISVEAADGRPNAFTVTFTDVPIGTSYVLSFGEGTFSFNFADSTYVVPAINVVYSVKEPEATAQQLKEAGKLLAKTGLGCPSATSIARQTLQKLFDEGGTISEFAAAIEAYKNDTDIELPADGKYYTISAVASTGRQLYLKYEGMGVSLTANQDEAGVFRVEKAANGTTAFVTTSGKYMKQLTSSSLTNGLTDAYDADVNAMTLGRLLLDNHSVDETLGYFFICDPEGVYALVDVEEGTFQSKKRFGLAYFDTDFTNAFLLTEVSGDTVGIHQLAVDAADGKTYDLQGRRVTGTLQKGHLYIRDGRKIVIK